MNNLEVFKSEEFGEVRTIVIDSELWFVATDICKALELSNPTMALERLDEDERSKFNLGRQGEANIVNEYGLYNLILASRKSEAKAFKRWITHDVIPSIRKSGSYSVLKYQPKATSVGEVASLLKIIERTMKAEKQSPEIIAKNIEKICKQFGIELTEDFIKTEECGQMAFMIVGVKQGG